MKYGRVAALVFSVAALFPQLGEAQGRSDREWQNNVFVYGVLPAINGDARVGPIEEPVDISIGDFLDKLQMGFMGAYRGSNDRFSVVADFLYMALGDSSDSGLIRRADVDQLIVDVTGGYRFSNTVEAFAGLRVTDVSTSLTTTWVLKITNGDRGVALRRLRIPPSR